MPFILILVGIILFVTAVKGTTGQLATLLTQDLFGGFIYWFVAIFIIGAVGYIKPLKGLSNAFLVLILLVLVLSNKGFFARFNQALADIKTIAATQTNVPNITTSTTPNAGNIGALG